MTTPPTSSKVDEALAARIVALCKEHPGPEALIALAHAVAETIPQDYACADEFLRFCDHVRKLLDLGDPAGA
jgi:hypothetical protein